MLKTLGFFRFSILLTLASIVFTFFELGTAAVFTIIVLIAIELAFSIDNAIINAKVLERLSPLWQKLFLTIGMVFAIVGMRFVFPILIVMVTAGLPWGQVIDEALNKPDVYAHHLEDAHAAISAFGGAFLMALALFFFFDEARKELWLKRLERPLQKLGGTIWLPPLLVCIMIGLLALFASHDQATILRAGLIGAVTYTAIHALIEFLGKVSPKGQKVYTGWPAFLAFMYLQILDASFSFDGVLGAFAITDKIVLIALGLGVGAIWVRSITVYLVRHGTLNSYKYLEHGAHYAIFVLALALLSSLFIQIPEAITGIVGLGVIGASFVSSREASRAKKSA